MARVKYTHAQIQERYSAWAVLPCKTPEEMSLKAIKWNEYCDARDGLPDGVSAGESLGKVNLIKSPECKEKPPKRRWLQPGMAT